MGKKADDALIDGGLDAIALCVTITVTSAEPANQAAIAGLALAQKTIGPGDFTKANGDTSGRKVTVAQQTDEPIDTTGTATHVVIDDGANIFVTTCTSQALTAGGTVTIPAFDIEISDPA